MNSTVAEIVGRYQPVHPNLLLDAEVPLMDVSLFKILRKEAVGTSHGKCHIGIARNGKWITSIALPWICKTARQVCKANLTAQWRRIHEVAIPVKVRVIVKEAVCGADYHQTIAFWIPRQSGAQREASPRPCTQ